MCLVPPVSRRLPACPSITLTGLQPSEIATVEVLGGSTRVPAVFKLVETVFGVTPSRTLNAKEVVSRGAALQCAMISPLIKVGGLGTVFGVVKFGGMMDQEPGQWVLVKWVGWQSERCCIEGGVSGTCCLCVVTGGPGCGQGGTAPARAAS